jgi:Signal transduction histidine kinase
MTKKIFRSIFIVAMIVFLSCFALIMGVLYNYYNAQQESGLKTELSLVADGIENVGIDYLNHIDYLESRLTLVSATGDVLFDSQVDFSEMENHAERKEIKEALINGTGQSSRYSSTLTKQTVYYAKRLSNGSVLRVSMSRYTILALIFSMIDSIVIILAIALILSVILSHSLSKRIVKPLENVNLDKPMENDTYNELAPILTRLEEQHRQIHNQREELKERKNEFFAVISNMNEGLVLLGENRMILSINPAAESFFNIDHDYIKKDFILLERDPKINKMISLAEESGKGELVVSRDGREYQLSASRVETRDKVSGVVILIFDMTEKVFAERNRKEFTANVSHELKTPLQSIMGSAELIQNGLVKDEDIPQFVKYIRLEASRMVTLIEDIIRLSQLDEQTDFIMEEIDLFAFVNAELESLRFVAENKHVTLSLHGKTTIIKGVHQLLHEVVYNLCDNAIKYNVNEGHVIVTVKEDNGNAVLIVEDTGIGISKEHQLRIFERFYRVDKSHSKQIGGTGLGLSIVKHALQYMNGTIDLESKINVGTTITVTIPK